MNKNIKNYYKKYSAFSMAEAMIILLIIAILLAVSAPLIARKSDTDKRKLIQNANSTNIVKYDNSTTNANIVQTAMGKFQAFIIGAVGDRNNDKLVIFKDANFLDTITIGDGFSIKNDRIEYRTKIGGVEKTILRINNTGESNIKINPSSTTKTKCTGVCIANDNGYIYIKNTLAQTITLNSSESVTVAEPESATEEINLTITTETSPSHETMLKSYPMLLPISKGTKYKCSECYFVPLQNTSNINKYIPVKHSGAFDDTQQSKNPLKASPNTGVSSDILLPQRYAQVNDFFDGKYDNKCSNTNCGCYSKIKFTATFYDDTCQKIAKCNTGPENGSTNWWDGICEMSPEVYIGNSESEYIKAVPPYQGCNVSVTTGGINTCKKYGFKNCENDWYCTR